VLVGADDGGIDDDVRKVGIVGHGRRSHTPIADQRSKRRHVLFQFPSSAGRSRHGAPVRAIHSTASTKAIVAPGGARITRLAGRQ
jgi:hypothetical protein